MTIRITVKKKKCTSYYYYPDKSCKTKDGGMKMLLRELKKINEPYTLEVHNSSVSRLGDRG